MLLRLQQFVSLLGCTTPVNYVLILTYDNDCNQKEIAEHELFLVTKVTARICQGTELNSFA